MQVQRQFLLLVKHISYMVGKDYGRKKQQIHVGKKPMRKIVEKKEAHGQRMWGGKRMRWGKYGTEMGTTRITKKAVAEILAERFDAEVIFYLSNDGYNVPSQNQRLWRTLPPDSIRAKRYNGEKVVRANYMYWVKPLPLFLYKNGLPILGKALEQLELRGAIVNNSIKINLLLNTSCIGS